MSLSNQKAARHIESVSDIADGVRYLRRRCRTMRRVHDIAGDPPLRRMTPDLEGLARIVVAQQLSTASAAAIWRKTEAVILPFSATTILALDDAALRGAGLSAPKIRTLRATADAVADGGLDFPRLARMDDDEIRSVLTAIKGVGPWTADIFLMFCVGRADAFAGGDLALQLAAQTAFQLNERPRSEQLIELADRWQPWRGVAARLLWTYYATTKGRAGIDPIPVRRGKRS